MTRDKYDLVVLSDGDVEVRHSVSFAYVQDYARTLLGSGVSMLKVGGSVNFQSTVKFW